MDTGLSSIHAALLWPEWRNLGVGTLCPCAASPSVFGINGDFEYFCMPCLFLRFFRLWRLAKVPPQV